MILEKLSSFGSSGHHQRRPQNTQVEWTMEIKALFIIPKKIYILSGREEARIEYINSPIVFTEK